MLTFLTKLRFTRDRCYVLEDDEPAGGRVEEEEEEEEEQQQQQGKLEASGSSWRIERNRGERKRGKKVGRRD